MLPQVVKLKGMALDFLFPQWCVGCGKEGVFLCHPCRRSFSEIKPPICPKCGVPQFNPTLCQGCARRKADIDGIRSPYRFDGVMRKAIHQLKYQNLRALAVPLAELLAEYLAINPLPAEVLMPVPLHRKRFRERGYNQSGLLARELGKLTGMPVIEDCLIRQIYASPQARTVNVEERKSNVTSAFICGDRQAEDKQILLIDDVATSGATLDACASALRAGGAGSVWGLTLAREI